MVSTLRTTGTAVWAYIRLEVPYLAQAVAEIALLVPLTLVFMPWARYWSPWVYFWLLLCLMLIPFNLMRVLSVANTAVVIQRVVLGTGLFLSLFLGLRTLLYGQYPPFDLGWILVLASHILTAGYPFWMQDVTVLLVTFFVWWRGVRLLSRSSNLYLIGLQLRLRALVAAPVVAFLAYVRLDWDVTPFLALFLAANLLVVALARVDEVTQEGGEALFEITPSWLAVVGGVSTAVVLSGVWLASLASQEQFLGAPQLALQLMTYTVMLTLFALVGPLLITVLEQSILFFDFLLTPIAELLANFNLDFAPPLPPEQAEVGGEQAVEAGRNLSFIPILLFALFFLFVAFLVLYSVRRSVGRTHVKRRASRPVTLTLGEEGEEAHGRVWDSLRNLLPALRAWRMAASIRRIYQQMVAVATEDGYPRGDAETPFEYQTQLAELWPSATAETTLITQAYVRVRYGELPETRAELEAIFAAWERLVRVAQERRQIS